MVQQQTAVVTGAGSGVGRAVALKLAAAGWRVVVTGRRDDALRETVRLAGDAAAERMHAAPCDVADSDAVHRLADDVLRRFGGVQALVNSAGTNVPQRGLDVLTVEQYRHLIDVNLNGTFYCVHAFLPAMRRQRSGTIVNVVSDAGPHASPKAGPGYVASKFGVTGLTQSIN